MDLLVVADDLTGANDTGGAFADRGLQTQVRRHDAVADWPPGVDVGVVDTDSRYESPQTVAEQVDGAVAMYHVQGHIPIKMLGFGDGAITGVNMTTGLPIVRTSVDHGTAFDIAGRGVADSTSLVDAVRVAVQAAA